MITEVDQLRVALRENDLDFYLRGEIVNG